MRTRIGTAGLVLSLLASLPGCGSNELESPTAVKLKALSNFYLDYAVAQQGKGPASEEVLKKHIRSQPEFILKTNGIEPGAIDGLFKSDRDQEPFVVVYGKTIARISGDSTKLLVYEKTGRNGKRLIAYDNGKVDHVNEARLKELAASKS
jgi:hypothetical protein